MRYQVVRRCNFIKRNGKRLYPDVIVKRNVTLWQAKWFRFWDRFTAEGMWLTTWRHDIEPMT